MRNISLVAVFLGLSVCLYSQQPVMVLKNVSIIDGTGAPVRRNTDMVISGGVIKSIGGPVPAGAATIDMSGRFIMPLIRAATLNSATLLRAEGRTGSLEPGKDASFIVLEDNPSASIWNIRDHMEAVWARGRKVSDGPWKVIISQ